MSAAKLCKYECQTEIHWDNANGRFIETDGTPHTKERCESLKKKEAPSPAVQQQKQAASGKTAAPDHATSAAIDGPDAKKAA